MTPSILDTTPIGPTKTPRGLVSTAFDYSKVCGGSDLLYKGEEMIGDTHTSQDVFEG